MREINRDYFSNIPTNINTCFVTNAVKVSDIIRSSRNEINPVYDIKKKILQKACSLKLVQSLLFFIIYV